MRFPSVRADTITAYEMYHSLPYFTSSDIKKLFSCCGATATKIAKAVKEQMITEDVKLYCEHDQYLDRDILYKLAGMDLKSLEVSYRKLKRGKL